MLSAVPATILAAAFDPLFDEQSHVRRSPRRTTTPRRRVLVVDDERLIADTLAEILSDEGFEVVAVYGGIQAVQQASLLCPHAVIADVMMPGMNGVEAAKLIADACPDAKILLISGHVGTGELLDGALSDGYSFEVLPKPIRPEKLLAKLRS